MKSFLLLVALCFVLQASTLAITLCKKNTFDKLDKYLMKHEPTDDEERNYELAREYALEQDGRCLFRDGKLVMVVESWGSLKETHKSKHCSGESLRSLSYLTKDVLEKTERLSSLIKPLAMQVATECAYTALQPLFEQHLHGLSREKKANLFRLFSDEFIEQYKNHNKEKCSDADEEAQLFPSACNGPYANVDQLARAIIKQFPLPKKVTHEGKVPANIEFSSFSQAYHQQVVSSCQEFVDKTGDFFRGLITLTGYWEDGFIYNKFIAPNQVIMNNLFRFNMCKQVSSDRRLDEMLLLIVAKLRGEI